MKRVFKLGNFYIDIEKIKVMTKPYVMPAYRNPRLNKDVLAANFWIDGKVYEGLNYIEITESGQIDITEETEKQYADFLNEANELFEAFINRV